MPLKGTLKTWNDDRGFGFIAPTGGGRELFVHISAFPRDGSRPTIGETLTCEIGRGDDGKLQAVRVYREGRSPRSTYPRARPSYVKHRRSSFATRIVLVLLIVVGAYVYFTYRTQHARLPSTAVETAGDAPSQYRCDGRTHCSQMTSCSEAKFFLKNCPGTQMDGDNDGVPCEEQWCTNPSAE